MMPTRTVTTYGPGGFDPDKPNNNIVDEQTIEVPEDPPSPDERIAALEAKLTAVEALATKADATAQEVAQAVKDAAPGQTR